MDTLEGQPCPVCANNTLTLSEVNTNIPHFGNVYILSMNCSECGFKKSDVECEEKQDPVRLEFEITSPADLKVRFVKSSEAYIKYPQLKIDIEPGINAEGYVANIEKALDDLLQILNHQKEEEEDNNKRKKIRKLVDQVLDAKEGKAPLTIIVEDPSGNSAILSEKTRKSELKTKQKKARS